MSVGAFLAALRRRWIWVALSVVLAVAAALLESAAATPQYSATASEFFSIDVGNTASELAQGSTYAQNTVASYALLARTPTVLQPVVDSENLAGGVLALADRVTAEVVPGTVVVDVSVTDPSPAKAAELANAVTQQLGTAVEALAPVTQAGKPSVRATTVASAVVPGSPVSPRTTLYLLVALLGGLVGGALLALARDATDTRVRTPEDVAMVTPLPVLASVDTPPAADGRRRLVVSSEPHSVQAERYRSLRTAVQFTRQPGRSLSLLVTSARPREGKSTLAANLAIAFAEAGLSVALLDADLRRPSVGDTFGLEQGAGLTSVLIGMAEIGDVRQSWGPSGLHVVTTGPLPPNPSELLSSPAMEELLATLEATHDVVILDGAPLLAVTDSVLLSRLVSGTLLVGDSTKLRRRELRSALALLERAGSRVVGVVLGHVRQRSDSYGYGYAADAPTDQATAALARTAVSRSSASVRDAAAAGSLPSGVRTP